jgi:hypothetical protein
MSKGKTIASKPAYNDPRIRTLTYEIICIRRVLQEVVAGLIVLLHVLEYYPPIPVWLWPVQKHPPTRLVSRSAMAPLVLLRADHTPT